MIPGASRGLAFWVGRGGNDASHVVELVDDDDDCAGYIVSEALMYGESLEPNLLCMWRLSG